MKGTGKAALKKLLMHPSVATRLRRFYYPQEPLLPTDVASAVAQTNVWLFTQKKSGTTLLCHSLAFYNAIRLKVSDINFGSIERGGVGRKVGKDYQCLKGLLEFQNDHCQKVVVHTHHDLPGCEPPWLIVTTRDPFDYAVSSYFYFYRNRHSSKKTPVEVALPEILDGYCRTYHLQVEAAQRCQNAIAISYEQLVAKPFEALAFCIGQLYGSLDAAALERAIQMASVDRLKSYERSKGAAVVAAADSFASEHFVRSGKVGEGVEFFSRDQQALIYKLLQVSHVPANGAFPSLNMEVKC